ncbi:folylpolyglutamate synthase [Trichophyton violaceum]|uniref:tetrahydrofolate synthase n=1 Tax=Trichophyton violaceum TaxID=34388 RepID=A0A178FJ98_TRIVO|nr:folylpolyglutamate synthase [Trichophyton violaceum]
MDDTAATVSADKIGTYLKAISNSPSKKKLFFDTITSKIDREARWKKSSQAEFFAKFKSGQRELSEQQVERLVKIVNSWDLSDTELADLRVSVKGWINSPSSFFESDKPRASGTDGLIQLCLNSIGHLEETGGTHRKLDAILLDQALQHKEDCLQERPRENSEWNDSTTSYRSKVVTNFINCYFNDLSEDDKHRKHRKICKLRVSGQKWSSIRPRWILLALNNANTKRFEHGRLELIEIAALNAYILRLKAYQEKNILKPAFREIVNEYKRRSLQPIKGNRVGQEGLEWLDSFYLDDSSGSSGTEELVFPPVGLGNDASDTGPPTLYTRYRGGGSGGPRLVNGNYPNHLSPWTNFEQRGQAVLVPRCSPHLTITDGIRLHQTSSDIPGGHGIISGWFQEHDNRDAGADADVSQQGGEQNAAGCKQQSSQLQHRHQAETRAESFGQREAKRRRPNNVIGDCGRITNQSGPIHQGQAEEPDRQASHDFNTQGSHDPAEVFSQGIVAACTIAARYIVPTHPVAIRALLNPNEGVTDFSSDTPNGQYLDSNRYLNGNTKTLLDLLYALGCSQIRQDILFRGLQPQKRWNIDGGVHEISLQDFNLSLQIAQLFSDQSILENAIDSCVQHGLIERDRLSDGSLAYSVSNQPRDQVSQLLDSGELRLLGLMFTAHIYPQDEILEPSFHTVGKLLLPMMRRAWQYVEEGICPSLLIPTRDTFIEATLAACRLSSTSHADSLISALTLMQNHQLPDHLRIAIANQRSISLRFKGEHHQSDVVIRDIMERISVGSSNIRVHCAYGHLQLSRAENAIMREDFDRAKSYLAVWEVKSPSPSGLELKVVRLKNTVLGRISRYEGHFQHSSHCLENCLGITPGNASRYHIMHHLGDVYCELNKPEQAIALVELEVEEMMASGKSHTRQFRRLALPLAEAYILQSRQCEAREYLCKLVKIFEDLANPNVADQVGHIRVTWWGRAGRITLESSFLAISSTSIIYRRQPLAACKKPSTQRSQKWTDMSRRARAKSNLDDMRGSDDMVKWLQLLGHSVEDLNRLNAIHIAGTKGKGSTCAFVASFLKQHGDNTGYPQKIGLYTSPHIRNIRERIRINSEPISQELFTIRFFEIWDKLPMQATDTLDTPRYLQLLALLSFHIFIKESVDVAVYETHLGGEFDATNIISAPIVTGITSISIDHHNLLGPTIEDIAWHKAGILKSGSIAFSTLQEPAVATVLQQRAAEKGVALKFIGLDSDIPVTAEALKPKVQRLNCSLALAVFRAWLSVKVSPEQYSIDDDIVGGIENFCWPGRYHQINNQNYQWFLDGAHTESSLRHTVEWFAERTSELQKLVYPT